MSRENEQFASSINTTDSVVDYLSLENTDDVIREMIMNDEPTSQMIADLWEYAIPADEDYFFWGDVEYNRK